MEGKSSNNKNFALTDYHLYSKKENVVISYKGAFTETILAHISQHIRRVLITKPQVMKKVLGIFIELAQNISYYSSEKNYIQGQGGAGVGVFIIEEHGEYYKIITGNFLEKKHTLKILHKCQVINSLSRDELREYKRLQRTQSYEEKGANIGLIQVALTAKKPLQLELAEASNGHDFFALSVDLEKSDLIG